MKHFSILVLLIFIISCSEKKDDTLDSSKPFNGKITYNILYPYNQKDPFLNLYPTKLIAEINDTVIHTRINDLGINIDTYFNIQKHEVTQFIEIAFPHYQLYVHLNEQDIIQLNNKCPAYTFKSLEQTTKVGSCQIKKVIATPNDSSKDVELWTTDDIDLKAFNYFGPFQNINKSLLQFETTNLGFKTIIRAKNIESGNFEIPPIPNKENFHAISVDSLENIIANIFSIEQ